MPIRCRWSSCLQSYYVINVCIHTHTHMDDDAFLINTHTFTKSCFFGLELIWYNHVQNHQWVSVIIEHSIRNIHSYFIRGAERCSSLIMHYSLFEFHLQPRFIHISADSEAETDQTKNVISITVWGAQTEKIGQQERNRLRCGGLVFFVLCWKYGGKKFRAFLISEMHYLTS